MKKHLFIAVLFLGMISLKAQEMHFGARVALSSTKIKYIDVDGENDWVNDNNNESKGKFNFEIGAFAEYMFNDQIAIAPEINYAGAGNRWEGKDMDGYWTQTYSLSYFQIPVMLKYYINENISINAGPQLSFLTSATDSSVQGDYSDTDDLILEKEINTNDFGLNIGGSYKMESGLFFDIRYYIGLSGLEPDPDNAKYYNFKNSGIKFGVGYYFN